MKIKTQNILSLALGIFAFTSAMHAQAFQLDFNDKDSETTETGWQAFSATGDANNKSQAYSGFAALASGDITITTTGVEFSRTTATDSDPLGLADVLRDMVLFNDPQDPDAKTGDLRVEISGLLAGTYSLTTYHNAGANSTADDNGNAFFDFHVQDADSASFSQNVGNFQMGDRFGAEVVTTTFVANGSDSVFLRLTATSITGGGTRDWIGINGMEISAVPEPSVAMLLGFAGLALLLRRRRA